MLQIQNAPSSPATPAPASLTRVLVEPTNRCNLDCEICLRRSWKSTPGDLARATFRGLLQSLGDFPRVPEVCLGGYGEPLLHPEILEMIGDLKAAGAKTSLVTNGTLLSKELSEDLIRSGLDRVWVSLDSAHQKSYPDPGKAGQPLSFLQDAIQERQNRSSRDGTPHPSLEVGLALVLTKSTFPQVLERVRSGKSQGISAIFLTNLEVYGEDLAGEALYQTGPGRERSDLNDAVKLLVRAADGIRIEGSLIDPARRCPFAEKGELAVRWDGEVSPCLPLLYDHASRLGSWQRQVYAYSLGNLATKSLSEIWGGNPYRELQARLLGEDFSPCFNCRDCWLSDDNLQDCMGFSHPTCGGCLWAQGLVSCP